jgi:hypothetical protein
MRVWLDDERPMPQDYDLHVKTAEEAIQLLEQGQVTHISLDHDLGQETTGYTVASWIERAAFEGTLRPLTVFVHTANPSGRRNILAALSSASRWSSTLQTCL